MKRKNNNKLNSDVKIDRYRPEVICHNVGLCEGCTRYKDKKCSDTEAADKLLYNLRMEIVCLTSNLSLIQRKHNVVWERLMKFKAILDDFYKDEHKRNQYIRPKFYSIFNGVIREGLEECGKS